MISIIYWLVIIGVVALFQSSVTDDSHGDDGGLTQDVAKSDRRRQSLEHKFYRLTGKYRAEFDEDLSRSAPMLPRSITDRQKRRQVLFREKDTVRFRRFHSPADWLQRHNTIGGVLDVIQHRRAMKIRRTRQLAKQFASMSSEPTNALPSTSGLSPVELANRRYTRETAHLQHCTLITVGDITDLIEMEVLTIVMPTVLPNSSSISQHTTTITIYRRVTDMACFGRLTLDSATSSVVNGPFVLGTETDSRSYLTQYLEMITEGGRKQPISVKVKRAVSQQPQQVQQHS